MFILILWLWVQFFVCRGPINESGNCIMCYCCLYWFNIILHMHLPIVLGTNNLSLYCLANSRTLCNPSIFTLMARGMLDSPMALNRALKWISQSMLLLTIVSWRFLKPRMSAYRNGPEWKNKMASQNYLTPSLHLYNYMDLYHYLSFAISHSFSIFLFFFF